MSTPVATRLMTIEEFLKLPDDGVERELIRGELRERGSREMTRRNRRHGRAETRVSKALDNWLDQNPALAGQIVSGETGFILRRDPATGVGIDVAYVSAEVAAKAPESPYFEGPPVLAVEILSPSDTQEEIDEKIALYLESGVKIVWMVNPRFKAVTVYRPDAAPALYHESQTIDGEPHLPGFRAVVGAFF
jgi:Uma2 family endonuclease